jgi:hypothetical protein
VRGRRIALSETYRPSAEIHVPERREIIVVNVGKLRVERLPRGRELQQIQLSNGLYDQPVPFLAEKCFMARKLEIAGDAHGLIASIAKQSHDPFVLHGILPAAGAAYAST